MIIPMPNQYHKKSNKEKESSRLASGIGFMIGTPILIFTSYILHNIQMQTASLMVCILGILSGIVALGLVIPVMLKDSQKEKP